MLYSLKRHSEVRVDFIFTAIGRRLGFIISSQCVTHRFFPGWQIGGIGFLLFWRISSCIYLFIWDANASGKGKGRS